MEKTSGHDVAKTTETARIAELEALGRVIEVLRTSAEKFLHNHIEAERFQKEDIKECGIALNQKVEVIKNLRLLINPHLQRTSPRVFHRVTDMISSFEIIVETEVAASQQVRETSEKIELLLNLLMTTKVTPENKSQKSQLDKLITELEELEQSTE